MSVAERRRRTFSNQFKQQKVREIETGRTKISEICRQYEVSETSVRRWLCKFGIMEKDKPERMIVESQSDSVQLLELKKEIAELQRIIGQKQLLIDFQNKMIEVAEDHYGIEIKKKHAGLHSDITGKTEKP